MEQKSNEEKANEICKRHIFDSNHFDCCMEMADWKDEKHKREKQQWIEKACERLEYYFAPDGSMVPENIRLWRDLQQVIKGE